MKITLCRIVSIVVLVAAAALAVWAMLPKPIPVDIAVVSKGQFVATVDEDGKTRIRERYVVAAPLAGRLTRVRLKAGDTVKASQPSCRRQRRFLIRAAAGKPKSAWVRLKPRASEPGPWSSGRGRKPCSCKAILTAHAP